MKLTGILVGSHFHPPAKVLLEHLPQGAALQLVPEPDNPYAPEGDALQVFIRPDQIPASQEAELALKLPGMGQDWDELKAENLPMSLGHVGTSDGKPMLKAKMLRTDLSSNKDFLAHMGPDGCEARLEFDGSGLFLVSIELPDEAP